MPENETRDGLSYEGFLSDGTNTVDLLRRQESEDPLPPQEEYEPSGLPASAVFDGPMADLVDLLQHHHFQIAYLERLPLSETPDRQENDAPRRFAEDVTNSLLPRIVGAGRELADEGVDISDLTSPTDLADRMAMLIPAMSTWTYEVGPFYDAQGAEWILGASGENGLQDLVSERRILELVATDGVKLYPAFQFTADKRVVSGLGQVLGLFDPLDNWMLASWLVSRSDGLSMTPMDALRQATDLEGVLAEARATAARWSR